MVLAEVDVYEVEAGCSQVGLDRAQREAKHIPCPRNGKTVYVLLANDVDPSADDIRTAAEMKLDEDPCSFCHLTPQAGAICKNTMDRAQIDRLRQLDLLVEV